MRKGVAAAALPLAALMGLAIWTAAAQARVTSIGPMFQERASVSTTPSVPTDGTPEKEREPETVVHSVLLNKAGGGGFHTARTSGQSEHAPCYFAEELLAYIVSNDRFTCSGVLPRRQSFAFLDPRLAPDAPFTPPKYSGSGGGVDDLRGKPGLIRRAVARRAAYRKDQWEPYTSPAGLRLDAAAELLSNPLAHTTTRKRIVRQLLATGDYSEPMPANDPRGRAAEVITLTDTSRAHEVLINNTPFDLTDAATLRRKLYVDPETSDMLATRSVLESTTRPELDDWLAEQGGSAVVAQTVYDRVRRVRDDAFRQRLRPCRRMGIDQDGKCLDIGKHGGRVVARGVAP
jgi:hypothetical protein